MNLDDNADACDRCRFWEHHSSSSAPMGSAGGMRPAPTISKAAEFEARWPITHESEWCGERRHPCDKLSAAADPAELSNHG